MTSLLSATVEAAEILERHAPWARISTKELASILHTDPATLAVWRWRGVGPPVDKSGRRPRYVVADVVAWLHRFDGRHVTAEEVQRAYLHDRGYPDVDQLDAAQLRAVVIALAE